MPTEPHRPSGPYETALERVWSNVWVRALAYLVAGLGALWLIGWLGTRVALALQVAIIGFVIAYILNPVVVGLQRLRIPRGLAVVIVYVALLNLLVLGSVLVSQVVVQLSDFVQQIPNSVEEISGVLASIQAWMQQQFDRVPGFLQQLFPGGAETDPESGAAISQQAQEQFQVILADLATQLSEALRNLIRSGPSFLVTGATNLISQTLNATLQVFLVLLASAYFLYDFPKFTENFRRFVPVRWRPFYGDLTNKADRAVGGYLRGQLLITSVLGVMIYIGLKGLGVPLAEAIAFLAAIFNLVPYLGPIIGVIPAVLLAFTVSPLTPLWVVLIFIIANQLEGNLLSPIILSRRVNLHPVTVLLAILAGLGLLGFVGALLAVPVVALVKVLLEDYMLTRPTWSGAASADADGAPDDAGPAAGTQETPSS